MTSLETLKKSILADGTIDAAEVAQLHTEICDDGVVDRNEADLMFDLNDATTDTVGGQCPEFGELFVKCITSFVLADDTSPGVVDEEEATYLLNRIQGDGQVDANERALLTNIKTTATSVHPTLAAFIETQGC